MNSIIYNDCFILIVTFILIVFIVIVINKNKEKMKKYMIDEKSEIVPRIVMVLFSVLSIIFSFLANFLYGRNIFQIFYNIMGTFLKFENSIPEGLGIISVFYNLSKMFGAFATITILVDGLSTLISKKYNVKKIENKDSIVVYTDCQLGELIYSSYKNNGKNALLASPVTDEYFQANHHTIVYDKDEKALSFLSNNLNKLKGKDVSVILNSYDANMFNEDGYRIYNINDLIAKNFWLENNPLLPWNKRRINYNIAFIGLNETGRAMFKVALMNNTFDVRQKIKYWVWGDKEIYDTFNIEYVSKTSNDEVTYCDKCITSKESISKLNMCDIIIISEYTDFSLQEIITRVQGKDKHIYIYDISNNDKSSIIFKQFDESPMISYFGSTNSLIKNKEDLFYKKEEEIAKEINYFYAKKYTKQTNNSEEAWKNASLYGKRSSIAAANYNIIRNKLKDLKLRKKELYELEHIRWCRFMLFDGWKYGKEKNKAKKTHPDLVKFSELSVKEQEKDKDIIEFLDSANDGINK